MNHSAINGSLSLENLLEEFASRLEAGEASGRGRTSRRPIRSTRSSCAGCCPRCSSSPTWDAPPAPAAPRVQGEPGASATGDGTLGDFRLIREVGRGGMGIVYEAEQMSLGRRVALKVLPFAATMDPRHLQRFQNEARAAASLHHTNIVPVYGVGCERGVHYYAMQFIEGRTLADFIAQQQGGGETARLRRPSHQSPERERRVGRVGPPVAHAPGSERNRRGRRDDAGTARCGLLPAGGRVGHPGGGGAGPRPHAGHRPSRREAGQPDGGRGRPAVGHRLRPGARAERHAA